MGSNGIMDFFWNSKLSPTGMAEVKSINAAVSLLIAEPGDNLPGIDTNTTRFLRHYTSKDTLKTTVHVSNYGESDIDGATLSWQVLGTAANGSNSTICQGSSLTVPALPQGPVLTKVAAVTCALPDLGTFAKNPQLPVTLTLAVQLRASSSGTVISSNSWRSRVYSKYEDGPAPNGARVYTIPKWTKSLPYSNLEVIPAAGGAVPAGSILVVDALDAAAIGFASAGSTVIVMHEASGTGSSSAFGGLPTEPAKFKTAWWLGSATDNNMGTVVYHDLWQGVFAGMAPDGWADEGWFRLIDGGVNYILDAVSGSVEVLVRSIDLMASSHNKALIWQTGFVGNNTKDTGAMIVSGLQLMVNDFAPGGTIQVEEAAWLLHSIITTAATAAPKPKTALQLKLTNCPGCLPPVNANLCPVNATLDRHSALAAAEERLVVAASEVAELKLLGK